MIRVSQTCFVCNSKYPNHRFIPPTNAIVTIKRGNDRRHIYNTTVFLRPEPHLLRRLLFMTRVSPSIYKLVNQGSICIHLRCASPSRSLGTHSPNRPIHRLCRWALVRWCGVGLRENIGCYLRISQTDLVPGHVCSRRRYIQDQGRQ